MAAGAADDGDGDGDGVVVVVLASSRRSGKSRSSTSSAWRCTSEVESPSSALNPSSYPIHREGGIEKQRKHHTRDKSRDRDGACVDTGMEAGMEI